MIQPITLNTSFILKTLIPDKNSGILFLYIISCIAEDIGKGHFKAGEVPFTVQSGYKLEKVLKISRRHLNQSIERLETEGLIKVSFGNNNKKGTKFTVKKIERFLTKSANDQVVEEKETVDWKGLVKYWNTKDPERKIVKMSEVRKSHVRARIRGSNKSVFIEMIDKFAKSDFLTGRLKLDDPFRADFDWAVKSENNYLKILENKYDNKQKANKTTARSTEWI